MVNSKNKETLSPLGFDPDLSGPVGAVSNRTDLERLINFKIYYSRTSFPEMRKSCCYSDPIALKYDRPNAKID